MATSALERGFQQFITATDKRCKQPEDWQDVKDGNLEQEATQAVQQHLRTCGCISIWVVPLKNIIAEDGGGMLELDELFAAEKGGKALLLATGEAKRKVSMTKIKEAPLAQWQGASAASQPADV